MSFIYLASPYSHDDWKVREWRYEQACKYAAHLMQDSGMAVFAPIAHSHPIAAHLPEDLLLSHEFWMAQDLPILRKAHRLVVLTMEGWEQSKGIQEETSTALTWGIPVEYAEPL